MKFSILLLASDKSISVINNINCIINTDYVCDIHVINNTKQNIDIDNNNVTVHVFNNSSMIDCINNVLLGLSGNIVILDDNITITKHFMPTLVSNYDPYVLNLFRTDHIENSIIVDTRIGKHFLSASDIINFNIAFNRTKIPFVTEFEKLYDHCKNNNITITLKEDIKTLSYRKNSSPVSEQKTDITMYKSVLEKQVKEQTEKERKARTFSIIIPFMYNGDRFDLFEASIAKLYYYYNDDDTVEIIVHETSPTRYLTDDFIKKYNIVYTYSKWDEVFHRAWALNIPAKYIAKGDVFVFFDADIIVTDDWVQELRNIDPTHIYIGWGLMNNLSQRATYEYINNNVLISEFERIRRPDKNAAAGGINVMSRDIFFKARGWDEAFRNTYGGEDNVLFYKMKALGFGDYRYFKSMVYHLFHSHQTFRDPERFEKFRVLKSMTSEEWVKRSVTFDFGVPVKDSDVYRLIGSYIKSPYSNKKQKKKKYDIKILWCKLNTNARVGSHIWHLLDEVKKIANVDVITKSFSIHPGHIIRTVNKNIKDKNYDNLITNTDEYDCIVLEHPFAFCEEWEKISTPIFMMYEDQHGTHNRSQLELAIKHKWNVLTKYQLKPFNNDINHQVNNAIWLPHSVNTSIFKDYGLRKDYDLLQTGAIFKTYELRNYVRDYFIENPYKRYRYIPRPGELDKTKWPVGADYAKEINKSWLSLCCGAKVNYPVIKFFEIPACRSILYTEYFNELGDLGFVENETFIQVDRNNITEQIKDIIYNSDYVDRILSNGIELIQQKHTTKTRAIELIDRLMGSI